LPDVYAYTLTLLYALCPMVGELSHEAEGKQVEPCPLLYANHPLPKLTLPYALCPMPYALSLSLI
jgi:hypothetical protein